MSFKKNIKKYTLLIGVLFLFPLGLLLFFGVYTDHHFNTLPYYGPKELAGTDTVYHTLPSFQFTNQSGEVFNNDSLEGKVWLAAFFATNSPNIKKITKRLLWPNFRYRGEDDVVLVCFTLDADHDTPEVLQEYVQQMELYNDFPGKWQFLTGEQDKIDQFIAEGFEIEDTEYNAWFYLVDTEGHLRGKYNGNFEEQVKDAIEDIALLKKEIDIAAYEEAKRLASDGDSSVD